MKIVTVIGARPQFVKAAVVSRELAKHADIEEILVHTGQHYDANMSDVFFEEMSIPRPRYNLNIGGGTHGAMTGRQLEKIEQVLMEEKPNCVMLYGDTNSTLAGALAATKLHIPVVHIEAGLRSFNTQMPEEINRVLTDNVSDILFCPTETAMNNLNNEGFQNKDIMMINVGDVMYDAALFYQQMSQKPAQLEQVSDDFVLVTCHRAENTDDRQRLDNIIAGLNHIADERQVIWPVHPRTRQILERDKYNTKKLTLIDPVSYLQMVWLLEHCTLVVTDSGGLQKEAYFFKKPCVTARDQTEWVELVECGANILVGADSEKMINAVSKMIDTGVSYKKALYGDGTTGQAIVDVLKAKYGS